MGDFMRRLVRSLRSSDMTDDGPDVRKCPTCNTYFRRGEGYFEVLTAECCSPECATEQLDFKAM